MDLNPYRFEAPWHAFEFAFHILEVRANLVIITMAWLTREDSKSFTRMPNEPDMDTLTYWAQRLEPVIRSESSEEVIVVFCNRTGMEGNAVYAGTSAVIGVREGEVKVYGLLGRGVKELLLVDTDDPPLAKMVQRDDAAHSNSQNFKPKPSNRSSRTDSSVSISSSTKHSERITRSRGSGSEERPASSPSTTRQTSYPLEVVGKKQKKKPPVRIDIPERHRRHASAAKTPIDDSPVIPTPTAPSPTPQSKRPQLENQGLKSPDNYIDTPYPPEDYDSSEGQARFDSTTNDVRQGHDEAEMGPDKYFWMPSSSLLEPSFDTPSWVLPEIPLPPTTPTIASTLIKFPAGSARQVELLGNRDTSPRSEKSGSVSAHSTGRTGRSQASHEPNQVPPERPATSNGVTPARPASPKSRNASRSGRQERRGSEIEQPDVDVMVERLEALRRRTQSAMSQRQEHTGTAAQPRPSSPKSRNASRSGRPNEIDHALLERTFNMSRTSIRIEASESVLAANIDRPASDILARDQRPVNGGNVRPPSRNRQHSVSGSDRPSSRGPGLLHRIGSPVTHIEPEESRTMLWSEISKIVGEHIGRPESQEAPRGRRRNESTSSMQARPGSRGVPVGGRSAPSQSRQQTGTPIRSVRYPSQGPPADPNDEIVAEIIFHRPGDPAQNSRSISTEAVVADAPSGRDSRQSQNVGSVPPKSNIRSPSARTKGAKQSPVPPKLKPKPDVVNDPNPPDLSGLSTHTLNSAKTSPKTPPPRSFEPSTPKAMVLEPDYGSLMSTTSDPLTLSDFKLEHLHAFLDDKSNLNMGRPRSAMM